MTAGLHTIGEEFMLRHLWKGDVAKPATVEVALYDDSVDTLTEAGDVGDVTTEPTDGNYTRNTVTLDSADIILTKNADGNYQVEFTSDGNDVAFDVAGTTGPVNAWFLSLVFQSQEAGDASAQEHIIFSKQLSQTYQLDYVDTLTLDNLSTELD